LVSEARTTRTLTKAELVRRVADRAQRYKAAVTPRLVDGWIERGLLPAGARRDNEGRRPIYVYGRSHYRRALQLVRLHSQGLRDYDAQIVQLYARGCGVRAFEVREPLRKEYRKAAAMLRASVRSTYADRSGDVPPKRKESFRRQLGDVDPPIADFGIQASDDDGLALWRYAVDPDVSARPNPNPTTVIPGMNGLFPMVWPSIVQAMAGSFSQDDENPNPVEVAINSADDSTFDRARFAFNSIRAVARILDGAALLKPFGGGENAFPGELLARGTIGREWSTFSLAMLVYLIDNSRRIGVPENTNSD
jgi:hypothetical protein